MVKQRSISGSVLTIIKAESRYTSSNMKLLHHLDRLQLAQTGVFKPIMLELAPTNKCDLKCVFCSVANRDLSKELSLDDIINAVETFKHLGLLSVELTGGGDPLCHPDIANIVDALSAMQLKLGLITNGLRLNTALTQKQLGKFEWIRISLNSLDYVKNLRFKIPSGPTLGFSYVWNSLSAPDKLDQVSKYAQKYNAQYVRVVGDCLSSDRIDKARKEIAPLMPKYPSFFFSMKGYDKPKECWLGYLRPFLNADGFIYRCSANPLINRKFHPHFRMCDCSQIISFWKKPAKPFPTNTCRLCFFKEQNELLSNIIHPAEHSTFI